MSPELDNCAHVFVRQETPMPTVTPACCGPFAVLKHRQNTAAIQFSERQEALRLERLKPDFLKHLNAVSRLWKFLCLFHSFYPSPYLQAKLEKFPGPHISRLLHWKLVN